MKFIKKALTLFMATCFTTSFFLTSCSKDEPEESENNGGSSQEELESTGDYLLKNGASSYKIVLPDDADADETLAGERLQSLFEEATDTLLPIVQDTDISSIDSDDRYILIGDNDFAVANGMVPQETDVKSTGYTIKTKDKCVYIAGGKSVGTLFGVYNFLGRILNYDYFAKEIYSLDKGVKELELYDYNVTVIPDCEVNYARYTFLTSAELKNYCMYATTNTGVRGMVGHNSLVYTLDDENDKTVALAIANHPKWFSKQGEVSEEDAAVNNDVIFASTQLCYTAHGDSVEYEKLYERMAQNLIDVMIADKDATNFGCSVSDNHLNCDCESCAAEISKYGTPTGSVVKLLNKMVETVDAWMESDEGKPYAREWYVNFLAYNNYQDAPAKLVDGTYQPIDDEVVCNKRIIPVVAYVGADYTSSIDAAHNKPYKSQCEAWKCLSDTVEQYIYGQNYKHYFIPYNTFGTISSMYKYFEGDRMSILGASNDFATGFDNLKIYLYGKLGVDVDANVEELIKKYFKNVYLDASDIMYTLFNEYRTNEQRLKEEYPNDFCATTSCYQTRFINSKYYEATLFEKWANDIEKAIDKIEYLKAEDTERYDKVYKMIVGERIWINYFYWQTNRNNILYETLERVTNDLIHDIEYCGVSYTREGPYVTTSDFISEMRTFLGEAKK